MTRQQLMALRQMAEMLAKDAGDMASACESIRRRAMELVKQIDTQPARPADREE